MNAKEIGSRLVKLRGGISQAQVAQDIGISRSAVGMYERGQRIPRDSIKMKFVKYFNVSVEDIFFAS